MDVIKSNNAKAPRPIRTVGAFIKAAVAAAKKAGAHKVVIDEKGVVSISFEGATEA
jgi:uncharacterized protein (DUF362 family)